MCLLFVLLHMQKNGFAECEIKKLINVMVSMRFNVLYRAGCIDPADSPLGIDRFNLGLYKFKLLLEQLFCYKLYAVC